MKFEDTGEIVNTYHYLILRAVQHIQQQGECTNLGVAVYDKDGVLITTRAVKSVKRAERRGDLVPGFVDGNLHGFMTNYPTLDEFKRHQMNFSYAMSCIQCHHGGSGVTDQPWDTVADKLFKQLCIDEE